MAVQVSFFFLLYHLLFFGMPYHSDLYAFVDIHRNPFPLHIPTLALDHLTQKVSAHFYHFPMADVLLSYPRLPK